ncbi:MAG TPA: thioredoxin domain-containing protein, partial [Urbifossiella sp.]|nr:thioredoxin domain-containing protein [Urbifossiella sp.]
MPNRLQRETSLYLKQHANNPVDWFPWGPEALGRARELDRPIFLSIGYSACHWCHVMEHESFENEATAKILNEHFVCIKVDREERPDLDAIYMNALQALTREGGGWPLSVFLSPDLTPFYAGTYFPPDDRYAQRGKPSFPQLLEGIVEAWTNRRDRIRDVGQSVAEFLNESAKLMPGEGNLSPDILGSALAALKRSYDPVNGGFGHAPKFPHALELRLLMRIEKRLGDGVALQMVRHTLDQMARGGIYDQIGGGFHRYSVDARWLVPHFEKMLYDNALLAITYTEAWQLTGDAFYKQIARGILDYVELEMTSHEGGFFSTQDADSEGEEGKFYVWSEAEIRDLLGPKLAELACKVWGVTPEGNFEGHNILHLSNGPASGGRQPPDSETLEECKRRLYPVRWRRVRPSRDEKFLTAWNGLMIAAFAKSHGAVFEPRYLWGAEKAADFVLECMRGRDGRLFRTAGVGEAARFPGYLEDYAFLADGLIALYQASFKTRHLQAAIELAESMLKHFADPNGPGFFFTADDHEQLIAR